MPPTRAEGDRVRWHDLECGGYAADLPLWRELAAAASGPVLDVGAGTGRVALELARAGHAVTALDHDGELLAALRERAVGLPVRAVTADARAFALRERFALCLAPMQIIQLLGGLAGRAAFLACARRHLRPGATLAATLADAVESFDAAAAGALPPPDVADHGGRTYSSQPVAVRRRGGVTEIHRVREIVAGGGQREAVDDVVSLDDLSVLELEAEALDAGFRPLPRRRIPPSREHVGSTVVLLRAGPPRRPHPLT